MRKGSRCGGRSPVRVCRTRGRPAIALATPLCAERLGRRARSPQARPAGSRFTPLGIFHSALVFVGLPFTVSHRAAADRRRSTAEVEEASASAWRERRGTDGAARSSCRLLIPAMLTGFLRWRSARAVSEYGSVHLPSRAILPYVVGWIAPLLIGHQARGIQLRPAAQPGYRGDHAGSLVRDSGSPSICSRLGAAGHDHD